MNENIDLTKILKNCPKGTRLYSYIFGEETYYMGFSSYQGDARPIFIYGKYGEGQCFCLSRNGHPYADNYGECCIFPNKEMRDWSKFTAPWYKKEKFDPKTLQPFDRVIVRNFKTTKWRCEHFSYFDGSNYNPCIASCCSYAFCIPYNEETKHLVGTSEEAPEFYRYWED